MKPKPDDELDVYIRLIADAAPPLTEDQRARLAAIFRPAVAKLARDSRDNADEHDEFFPAPRKRAPGGGKL